MQEKAGYDDDVVAEALTVKMNNLNRYYVEEKNKAYHPQGFFASLCTNDDWNKKSNNFKEKANNIIKEYEVFFSNKTQIDSLLTTYANMPLFEAIESQEDSKWKINIGWIL